VYGAKALLMIAGAAIALVAARILPQAQPELYVACYLQVVGSVAFPIWLLQGAQRFRQATGFALTGRALSLLALVLLVRGPADLVLAAAALGSAPLIAGALSIAYIRRTMVFNLSFEWRMLREVMANGWHGFLVTAAANLYTASNVFVLGLMAPPTAVAFFAAAQRIVSAATNLTSPLAQAAFPRLSAVAAGSRNATLVLAGWVLRYQALIGLGLSLGLLAFAEPIARLVLADAATGALPLIRIMSVVPLAVAISNVFGIQILFVQHRDAVVSRILLAFGAANLLLLVVLIPALAETGAAVALTVTEVAVTVALAFAVARLGLLKPVFQFALRGAGDLNAS